MKLSRGLAIKIAAELTPLNMESILMIEDDHCRDVLLSEYIALIASHKLDHPELFKIAKNGYDKKVIGEWDEFVCTVLHYFDYVEQYIDEL